VIGLLFEGSPAKYRFFLTRRISAKKAYEMTLFTFQVVRPDGSVLLGDRRDLSSTKELWGHLEVMAIQLRRHRELQLIVRDTEDGIVAMSGVASVIDSLKLCRQVSCPIKGLLAGSVEERGASAPCMTIAALEIPRLDLRLGARPRRVQARESLELPFAIP
jgi:hypothetical protein